MTRAVLPKSELDAMQRLAERLRDELAAVDVRIFGSVARGESTSESDIDLLVVLREADWPTEQRVYDLCFEASLEVDKVVSAVVYSASEFSDPKSRVSPFVKAVEREGIAI